MNCTCNDYFAKRKDQYPPLTLAEACATCAKRTGDGNGLDTLKACSQCKAIKYCSRECQKNDWPSHKHTCRTDAGKGGMRALMRSAVYGHPLLHHFIMICAFILHGLDGYMPESERLRRIQSPLYMQMDVGIEPTDINETIRLCHNPDSYDVRAVEGMLQIYRLSVNNPLQPEVLEATETVRGSVAAAETRERLDALGKRDFPLVILSIVNSQEMCIQMSLFLPPAMPPTDAHNEFLNQTVRNGSIASPRVADYINHLNEHIRADKDNLFSLRTKMRADDKKLILEAMRNEPFRPAVYCRRKIMREPIYKPLWDLFERKKEYEIAESTA